jgi:hypothetical protein
MSTKLSASRVRTTYAFIKANRKQFSSQMMCRVLGVAPSGYYEWLQQPVSNRGLEDGRLLRLIRASYTASQGIYGAPRVFLDLREAGETCSKHRVARLMRTNGLRALHGYRARRWSGGKPTVLVPNPTTAVHGHTPDTAWVTDITYIRTWQGWLYLAVVIDLFSRRMVGWSTRAHDVPRARPRRRAEGCSPPTASRDADPHRSVLQSHPSPQSLGRSESGAVRSGAETPEATSPPNPGISRRFPTRGSRYHHSRQMPPDAQQLVSPLASGASPLTGATPALR